MRFILVLLLFSLSLFARMPEDGEYVNIFLKSGIEKKATFMGISKDTVLLGGYIKNEFTIVKILKKSFQKITSEANEELSLEESENQESVSVLKDSLNSKTDSLQEKQHTGISKDSSESTDDYSGRTLFVPFLSRPIDSLFTKHLESLVFAFLEDKNLKPLFVPEDISDGCKEPVCFLETFRNSEADAVLFGKVSAEEKDSLRVELTYFNATETEPEEASFLIYSKEPFMESLSENRLLNSMLLLLKKDTIPKIKTDTIYKNPELHYVQVHTEPEGATLIKKSGSAICKTPCTFAHKEKESLDLYAYWGVDTHLWAAKETVSVLKGDTAKVFMLLKKIKPKIQIITNPEQAEIYVNKDFLHFYDLPVGVSPKILDLHSLEPLTFRIFKEGYKDTSITFSVLPTEQNKIEIDLTPITVPQDLKLQQDFLKQKKKRTIGLTVMGTSLIPLIMGGVFMYLAHSDYDKARDLRDELKIPHIGDGKNYEKKKKENKEYIDKGDTKTYIGIGNFIGASLLFVTGIVISF